MRLLINTASTFKGGGVQVALSFLHEINAFNHHDFHVLLSEPVEKQLLKTSYPENFTFYSVPLRPGSSMKALLKMRGYFKELEKKINPDCVFTTTGPSYWRPSAPHLCGYNLPHHVYPESPYFHNLSFKRQLNWLLKRKLWQYWFAKDADAFVVQTDDVNQRLKSFLNTDKVFTVSNTCSHVFRESDKTSGKPILPSKEENEFRLLSIGAHYPHKNLDIINEISKKLVSVQTGYKIRFVLTLPDKIYQGSFSKEAKQIVYNAGPQSLEDCPALYRETDALFLPTLLECFSASYAEAMAMERPIITTDMGFARSICGDAALYFKPKDPASAIENILKILNDKALYENLKANGIERLKSFNTSHKRAESYLKLCENLVSSAMKESRRGGQV